MKNERGSGTGEAMLIMGIVAYILFMGWLGNSLGYTSNQIGPLSNWSLPYVEMTSGWSAIITGTVDFLIAIVNVLGWVLGAMVSFAVLVGWGLSGNLPAWVSTVLFMPVSFGMGWLVLSMVRGR